MEGVATEQIAVVAVDDVQGNIHSRDNTRAVECLNERYNEAKKEWLFVRWKRPWIDMTRGIISLTCFTTS